MKTRINVTRWRALAGVLVLPLLLAAMPPASPVADAAAKRDLETVKRLIKSKADVNAPQGDGMTALHWAGLYGDAALTDVLLKAGAKVRVVNANGAYSPLHLASKTGAGPVVRALIKAGADVKGVTESGATALHLAAGIGSVDALAALLDAGANPNARENEWGQTPLIFAATSNRGDAIRLLIKRGANPALRTVAVDLAKQGAQDQAATRKRNEVLAELRGDPKPDSAAAAAGGRNAGAGGGGRAAAAGGTGAARGPRVVLTPTQTQKAIEVGREVLLAGTASAANFKEEVDTANGGQAGFTRDVGGMGGFTPLHHAARNGSIAAAMALVDGGADINARSSVDSTTPLLQAAINGQFDVEMALIQRGANVNLASTISGVTPLWATINQAWDMRTRYPQQQALQYQKISYLDVMEALLKAGAQPNVRIKSQPFYFAYTACGNSNCGLENVSGTTALWRAAYSVDVAAMRILVKYGADPMLHATGAAARGGAAGGAAAGAANAGTGRAAGAGAGAAAATAVAGAGAGAGAGAAAGAARGAGAGGGAGAAAFGGGSSGDPDRAPVDPNAARGPGSFPIHCAAGVGYGNGVGAGNSHRYVPDGWIPAMKYLVEELHIDPNLRDNRGATPMHYAAARGDNDLIKYLVSKGADPKLTDSQGRTTVDMANGPTDRIAPYPATIALLESMGVKNNHRCKSC